MHQQQTQQEVQAAITQKQYSPNLLGSQMFFPNQMNTPFQSAQPFLQSGSLMNNQPNLMMMPMQNYSLLNQNALLLPQMEKSPQFGPLYVVSVQNSPQIQPLTSLPPSLLHNYEICSQQAQQKQQQQINNILNGKTVNELQNLQASPLLLSQNFTSNNTLKKEEIDDISTMYSTSLPPSQKGSPFITKQSIFSQQNSDSDETQKPSFPVLPSSSASSSSINSQQICKLSLSGVSPDRNNEWCKYFLENAYVKSIFPEDFGNFPALFTLQSVYDPLQIRLRFPTKEQFLQKAEKLHKKKRSKFHNKNKLFFISIIKIFKKKQVQKFFLPGQLFQKFFSLVHACRIAGRKMADNKISKTDLFNHSHYNLLFLTLNERSIEDIAKNDQDYKIHLKVFGIDLRQKKIVRFKAERMEEYEDNLNAKNVKLGYRMDELYYQKKQQQEQQNEQEEFWEFVQYINFLKICVYQVVVIHLKEQMIGSSDQQSEEREYDYRAFKGILDMIKGNARDRF